MVSGKVITRHCLAFPSTLPETLLFGTSPDQQMKQLARPLNP